MTLNLNLKSFTSLLVSEQSKMAILNNAVLKNRYISILDNVWLSEEFTYALAYVIAI